MRLERLEVSRWQSQRFSLRNPDDGTFQTHFSSAPSLNQLREASRKQGDPLDRLDLWKTGFECNRCGEIIEGRFSASSDGNLLCWECALEPLQNEEAETELTQTTDPTQAILSDSALNHKNLCDYVINVATGCRHGCKFCYVPSTPNIKMRGEMLNERANVEDGQREWGSYLLYRDDLPERLARKLDRKRKWNTSESGRGVVMISSGTDCYQDRRAAQITRGCVIELVKREKPVRILTRSPAVVRDLDVFKAADGYVTVGSSIPCLEDDLVRAIEPGAPAPTARLRALEQIRNEGVPVYVSMSPTYPTQNRDDLRQLLKTFKERLNPDVVFHEPINPRGANFDMTIQAAADAGKTALAAKLKELRDRETWVEYSLEQLSTVERLGGELDVPVHLWPDEQFVNALKGDIKSHMRNRREQKWSPEDYPLSPAPV